MPDITTKDGTVYKYDNASTGMENTYSLAFNRIIVENGANAGVNNGPTATGKTFHVDYVAILHNAELKTVSFKLKDAATGGFVNATDPLLIKKGSEHSKLAIPSLDKEKIVDGIKYVFNGKWYTDEKLTKEADFTSGKVMDDETYYAEYKAIYDLSVNDIDKTYDGKEDKISITGNIPKGYVKEYRVKNGSWTTEEPKFKNAINVKVDTRVRSISYEYIVLWTQATTVNIKRRDIVISTKSASKEYDGTVLTNENYEVNGEFVEGEGFQSISTTGSQTLVGSSKNTISYNLNDKTNASNCAIEIEEGMLIVKERSDKTKQVINLKASSASKTYDGTALTNNKVELEGKLLDGDKLETKVEGTITNAGTKEDKVVSYKITHDGEDVTSNYNVTTKAGTLNVNKIDITVKAESARKEYDGTALTNKNYKVYGKFVKGEGFQSVTVKGSQTFVGTSANEVSYKLNDKTNADNYNITAENGTLKVTERTAENKQVINLKASSASKTYDGTALTNTKVELEGKLLDGDKLETKVEGTITNAGTEENKVVSYRITHDGEDVTSNYKVTTKAGTLTVHKRDVKVIAQDNAKSYGTSEPTLEVSITGILANDTIEYSLKRSIGENIGLYDITVSGKAEQGNYNVSYINAVFIIYGKISYDKNDATNGNVPSIQTYDPKQENKVSGNSGKLAKPGYHFIGWNTEADGSGKDYIENEPINVKEDTILYAIFAPDTNITYTVETYYESSVGIYSQKPETTESRIGTTDSIVSMNEKDKTSTKENYVLDEAAANVMSGKVDAEGKLILKVYFAIDNKGNTNGGSDNIPDKYQIIFTYVSKGNGVVEGNVYETHTFKNEDGNYVKPTAVSPLADVNVNPFENYIFDYWTDNEIQDSDSKMSELMKKTYTEDTTFTAIFIQNPSTPEIPVDPNIQQRLKLQHL